jgi:hypothetical protein
LDVPLEASTIVFSVLLGLTFLIWYLLEKTLSIRSIVTLRRESFYWLAILFTFALGTAAGDLMAESLGLGYATTGIIVCIVIVLVTITWKLKLNTVLAFWIVYIMTRPLGASLGDYLSQSPSNGGLGMGATVTSVVFLLAILFTVLFLAFTKKDTITKTSVAKADEGNRFVLWQVAAVVAVFVVLSLSGYFYQQGKLQKDAALSASISPNLPLGDLSAFQKITQDTLELVRQNDLAGAKTRVADLETAWDDAEAKMKPMSKENWNAVDGLIDAVLHQLRSRNPDAKACDAALVSLSDLLNSLSAPSEIG